MRRCGIFEFADSQLEYLCKPRSPTYRVFPNARTKCPVAASEVDLPILSPGPFFLQRRRSRVDQQGFPMPDIQFSSVSSKTAADIRDIFDSRKGTNPDGAAR